jgi:hypothetical protein
VTAAKLLKCVALTGLVALSASCGEFTREGRAPAIVVVRSLQAASGAKPDDLGGTLLSDVVTMVRTPAPCSDASPCATLYNDVGEVTMSLVAKDPGVPGVGSNPSFLNAVTINRYHVSYRRADGRSVPGVDVPYAFDSALTFTVPSDGVATAGFQIVRFSAKQEAPLRALAFNGETIATIAEVTFYGRDQAGNDVIVTASIGVDFANFADPA